MPTNLTNEARQGYYAKDAWSGVWAPCPYLATSNSADAWHIGRWLNQTGRTVPRDVRPSRGSTFHVNGMKVHISYVQGCTEIERIA